METWLDQYEQRVCSADDAEAELARLRAEVENLRAELTRSYVLRNDVLCDELRAEVEKLRADVVWAVNNCAGLTGSGTLVTDNYEHAIFCDGTPAGILRAVKEAMGNVDK